MTDHELNLGTLLATFLTLLVAVATLVAAFRAIRRSDQNASAATLVAIQEAFRTTWDAYFAADADGKGYRLGDLANVLETACAIDKEKIFVGAMQMLLHEYLVSVLRDIKGSPEVRKKLRELAQNDRTFEYLRGFLKRNGLTE
ncbi:MAG TPA: hypothetical protein VGG27_07405 [Magnetospirillaceae bacterium]|jgi:hypothetical protein